MKARMVCLLAVGALLAACTMPKMPKFSLKMPRVHKVTVQQGNVITQEMIDRLKPGMTQDQVAFVMGEPIVRNTFNQDRWDYIYTIDVPGYYEDDKRISLYFVDGQLASFTGDYAPGGLAGSGADTAAPSGSNAGDAASEPVESGEATEG